MEESLKFIIDGLKDATNGGNANSGASNDVGRPRENKWKLMTDEELMPHAKRFGVELEFFKKQIHEKNWQPGFVVNNAG